MKKASFLLAFSAGFLFYFTSQNVEASKSLREKLRFSAFKWRKKANKPKTPRSLQKSTSQNSTHVRAAKIWNDFVQSLPAEQQRRAAQAPNSREALIELLKF